jgi:hypothetical protein
MKMANPLDDLFQWAAQKPTTNVTFVTVTIATNETTRNNLVSFAEGTLFYQPGRSIGMIHTLPFFASKKDQVTQYFSDRRYNLSCPFDCSNKDPLTVSISWLLGHYSFDVKSSKWGFEFSFEPSIDTATGILYGVHGQTFITVSLCNRNSEQGTG